MDKLLANILVVVIAAALGMNLVFLFASIMDRDLRASMWFGAFSVISAFGFYSCLMYASGEWV